MNSGLIGDFVNEPIRVSIRRYRESDVALVLQAVLESKNELSQWMPWCHADYGHADTESWVSSRSQAWDDNHEWSFLIIDQNDVMLGTCGFHQIDLLNGNVELGYWVRTSQTRKGIASAAIKVAANWVFKEREIHRLEILTSISNLASQRAAEKAGAIREAVLRERLLLSNKRHDAVLFAILNK